MWDCEQLAGKTVYLDANVFIDAFEGSHSLQLPSRAIATGCDCLISADQGLLRCDEQLEILSLTALSDS